MIDVNLLKYPEQFAKRLTQMEKDIKNLQLEVKRIKQGN